EHARDLGLVVDHQDAAPLRHQLSNPERIDVHGTRSCCRGSEGSLPTCASCGGSIIFQNLIFLRQEAELKAIIAPPSFFDVEISPFARDAENRFIAGLPASQCGHPPRWRWLAGVGWPSGTDTSASRAPPCGRR